MAQWRSPSCSYSRHSSYTINIDSIYPPGYSYSHPSSNPPQHTPHLDSVLRVFFHRGGNHAYKNNADLHSFGPSAHSKEHSYLGTSSITLVLPRVLGVITLLTKWWIHITQTAGIQIPAGRGHYSDPCHAQQLEQPIPQNDEDNWEFSNYIYTLGYLGDEREERREGLRFLKDYYPRAGCPTDIHCLECASHRGEICDGGARSRVSQEYLKNKKCFGKRYASSIPRVRIIWDTLVHVHMFIHILNSFTYTCRLHGVHSFYYFTSMT